MPVDLASFVRGLFPDASAELRALQQSVIDNGSLLPVDFLSIQDLLDVAGYSDQENLHVLLLLMFLSREEGSLSVEVSSAGLGARLGDLVSGDQAGVWSRRILDDLDQQRFPSLIGSSLPDSLPLFLHGRGDKRHLYFHKLLRSETTLVEELRKRLHSNCEPEAQARESSLACASGSLFDWQPIMNEVLRERPLQLAGRALALDPDQQRALEQALHRNFLVISGGPGTGKTSIVLTLLRILMRGGLRPDQVALAAPTGRAAQRLTDSLRFGLDQITPGPSEHDLLLHQLQAGTLHHLLDYSPTRGIFRRHAENPVPFDVVIVDEVSMVGVVLMAQLLQALPPRCKLILLGDKDQLPSVEAGAVLASLVGQKSDPEACIGEPEAQARDVPCPMVPGNSLACASGSGALGDGFVVLLGTNHRSQPDIQAAALAINRQDVGLASRLPGLTLPGEDRQSAWWKALERQGGCWLVESGPAPAELRHMLQRWAARHFLDEYPRLIRDCLLRPGGDDDPVVMERLRRLFRILEGSRILTLVREGAWGCVGINQYLDACLRPSLERGSQGHLFAGAPVLITANDHVRQLYNGDVGLVLKCSVDTGALNSVRSQPGSLRGSARQAHSLRAVFPRRGGFASFSVESLPAHELGWALTVHKSQGSEYDSVLLVLPPSGGRRLLTKEILYTGVTRARNLALIAGSRDILRLAIARKILRESAVLDLR